MEKQALQEAKNHSPFKTIYVSLLLKLLPTLVNITRHFLSDIQDELDYLGEGYTFELKVENSAISGICRITEKRKLRAVRQDELAFDVPFGSGLASVDSAKMTVDYVISFRSLDYAFSCFSGSLSLKEALAMRAFSTRGPNNTGVALTYMFTALLRTFFFWRRPYRKK